MLVSSDDLIKDKQSKEQEETEILFGGRMGTGSLRWLM